MLASKPSFSDTGLLTDYSRRCEGEERHVLGKAGTGAGRIVYTVPILVKWFLCALSVKYFTAFPESSRNKMDEKIFIRLFAASLSRCPFASALFAPRQDGYCHFAAVYHFASSHLIVTISRCNERISLE